MAYDAPSDYQEQVHAQQSTAISLVRVLEVEGDRARVRAGSAERWVAIDPSVDPALIESARQSGARVVLEVGAEGAALVGALMTARVAEIDRKGNLELHVKRFAVHAEDALLKTPRTFMRLRREAAEIFADEFVARGRILTRIFGKTIKLN